MIDLDFSSPLDQVRLNVGDPDSKFVSDNTINSALTVCNSNIYNASIMVFEIMLSFFSTCPDREMEGQVQVYYSKLYERYKDRMEAFKAKGSPSPQRAFLPIIIGGVSRTEKETIRDNNDNFSMYDLAHWHSESLGYRSVYEIFLEDTKLNNG